MNKAYARINWENYPSTDTPLNETNLNHMDLAVDTIDDRVITLDTTKADEADLLTCVASISFNSTTGIMTITLKNGTQGTIDTGLSKLAINFDYDDDPTSPHYQQIVMEMKDGTYKYIDLSALITQYEFTNSSTIAWTIGNDGTVSASVVDGSITAAKLQPNYLADIIVEVGKAQTAATNAGNSATLAESYAVGGTGTRAGEDTDNAKYYCEQAALIAGQTLGGLTDVTITSPTDGQALIYDGASQKWINSNVTNKVATPVPKVKTYTYDGTDQTFEWISLDTKHIDVTGDVKKNAGTYTVTATLKDSADFWDDFTTAPKTFSWSIAKANQTFDLSANSVSLTPANPTATVNISNATGDGAFSVSSSNTGVATASVSGNVISITGVATGSATITVTKASTTNYHHLDKTIGASVSLNVTVTLTLNGARNDIITIYDSDNQQVGASCTFTGGATSGTWTGNIYPNQTYKFVSSVATKLPPQTGNYEKSVTLDGTNQTINVYPDNVWMWYCNRIIPWTGSGSAGSVDQRDIPPISDTSDGVKIGWDTIRRTIGDYKQGAYVVNTPISLANINHIYFDFSSLTTLNAESSQTEYLASVSMYAFNDVVTSTSYKYEHVITANKNGGTTTQSDQIKTFDVSSLSVQSQIGVKVQDFSGMNVSAEIGDKNNLAYGTLRRVWYD